MFSNNNNNNKKYGSSPVQGNYHDCPLYCCVKENFSKQPRNRTQTHTQTCCLRQQDQKLTSFLYPCLLWLSVVDLLPENISEFRHYPSSSVFKVRLGSLPFLDGGPSAWVVQRCHRRDPGRCQHRWRLAMGPYPVLTHLDTAVSIHDTSLVWVLIPESTSRYSIATHCQWCWW